jgi:two-component system sensor histidine kinase/response regulator
MTSENESLNAKRISDESSEMSSDTNRKEMQQLQNILNAIPHAVISLTGEGKIITTNQAALSLTCFSSDELSHMSIFDLISPTNIDLFTQYFTKMSDGHAEDLLANSNVFLLTNKNNQDCYVIIDLKTTGDVIVATISESTELVELKNTRDELDISNERLRVAKDSSEIGVWELNLKTEELIWDEQMFSLYGRSPNTFEGTVDVWNEALHPDDKEDALEAIGKTIECGQTFDTNFRIFTPEKELRYIKAYGHLVRNNKGEPSALIGVNYDLTDYYKVQARLEESLKSNRVLAKVAEEIVSAVIITDTAGKIIWVNSGFTRITGFELSEVEGRSPGSVLQGKESNTETIDKIRESLSKQQGFDAELLNYHKDGTAFWIKINCQPLYEEDTFIGFMAIETDITEVKRLEDERASQQELLERTGFMAKLGSWQLDLVTNIPVWSDIVYNIHEVPIGDEIDLANALNFYPPEARPQIEHAMGLAINEGIPWDLQTPFVTAKGRPLWVRTVGYAEFTNGVATSLSGAFQDITDIKQAEQTAKEASIAKSQFLANMSHEIRTPINGVIGMNDLLLGSDLTEQQRHFAELIKLSSKSLLHLINDILDFSKIEAGKLDIKLADTNLFALLSDTVDTMAMRAQDKNLELILDIMPTTPRWVSIDSNRLKQVIINLLTNAIKFSDVGEIQLKVNADQEHYLAFEVIDSGYGIPLDKQAQLFTKFMQVDGSSTRKHGGTGLGLAISHQLVEMMGGKIKAISDGKKGSTFSFTIEYGHVHNPAMSSQQINVSALQTKRLLLVEPSESVQQAVTHFLSHSTIKIHHVRNAQEAIKAIKLGHSEQYYFDYVMIDLNLKGINGIELSKAIYNNKYSRHPAIMLMTAQNWSMNPANLDLSTLAAYIAKPLNPDSLIETLVAISTGVIDQQRSSIDTNDKTTTAVPAKANILVVEDNYINQEVVVNMLTTLNYTCQVACNGKEAITANLADFDMILMDCQMPIMDGYAATQYIRSNKIIEKHANIPIIAVTANVMTGDREKCLNAGMNDYLEKPISAESLKKMIEKWIS